MQEDRPQGAQSQHALPDGIRASDFHLIEDAVMETPRGRWFLREYAWRIRAGESARLLDAIARLQNTLNGAARVEIVSTQLALRDADAGPDIEQIMEVQEKLLDMVWYMRERGFDGGLCGTLTREAEKLFAAVNAVAPSQDVAGRAQAPASAHPVASDPVASDPFQQRRDDPVANTPAASGSNLPEGRAGIETAAGAGALTPPARNAKEMASATPARRERNLPLPSKAAALAQKASIFAAIDAMPERERLAFFS